MITGGRGSLTWSRDGEEESAGLGAGDVAHDVHAPSVPADEERGGAAEAAMAVATEEIVEAGGWREEAAAEEVGAASGASPHPVAVASGASEEIVRRLCSDDVRGREENRRRWDPMRFWPCFPHLPPAHAWPNGYFRSPL